MVPVGQEALQDRLRPFPPAARPRRAPPLGPVRSLLHKWKAQSQPRYFSHACGHLCPDAPLFIHIRHKKPIGHCVLGNAGSPRTRCGEFHRLRKSKSLSGSCTRGPFVSIASAASSIRGQTRLRRRDAARSKSGRACAVPPGKFFACAHARARTRPKRLWGQG
jgi:hypothetical protein